VELRRSSKEAEAAYKLEENRIYGTASIVINKLDGKSEDYKGQMLKGGTSGADRKDSIEKENLKMLSKEDLRAQSEKKEGLRAGELTREKETWLPCRPG